MRSFLAFVFSSCISVIISRTVPDTKLSVEPDILREKTSCEEYLSLEDCAKQAASAVAVNCRAFYYPYYQLKEAKSCDEFQDHLYRQCAAYCAKASCVDCFEKLIKAVETCQTFMSDKVNVTHDFYGTAKECKELETSMVKYCTSKKCQVCKDLYCRNGGKCVGTTAAMCSCPPGFTGAFCHKNLSCIGENHHHNRNKLGTKERPAPNAQAIIDAGDSQGSGLYWIQLPGETAPAQTYCDMEFAGEAWMLASYGYVHAGGVDPKNHGIPNMNNPFGYNWSPNQRNSSNGVINLPQGAVTMANDARYMIMAAGNNPSTGGINSYTHVYRIDLTNNPYNITFANHNRYNGGQPGRMHITGFLVEALKGESGNYSRYALGEALGVTYSDSYPTGYGFYEKSQPYAIFKKGPFFPSVLSGSGRSPCSGCTSTDYEPDVPGGSQHYTYEGWCTANAGWIKTGQTSIWFK